VILEYNGQAIKDAVQLPRLAAASTPGSTARLVIWRGGARQELSVEVGEAQAERVAEAPSPPEQAANPFGLVLAEVPPAARRQLGIDYGLVVQAVEGGVDMPLRRGDIIIAVNEARFSSLAEFHRLLARHKAGETVAFLVRRGDGISYVTVKVPA
jgi:serine protease Do